MPSGQDDNSDKPRLRDLDGTGRLHLDHKLNNPEFQRFTKDATDAQKGNAEAATTLMKEVLDWQKSGDLSLVARKLEASGQGTVGYDESGQPKRLMFNTAIPTDIDLQKGTLNGKDSQQLRAASVQQSKDYIANAIADPKLVGKSAPLSPVEQLATTKLTNALLDGDANGLAKAAKEIMSHDGMAEDIQPYLDSLSIYAHFKKNDQGVPFMRVGDAYSSIVVPRYGQPRAESYASDPDFDKTMKSSSDWALHLASTNISEAEDRAKADKTDTPADLYTNMRTLELLYGTNRAKL